MGWILQHKLFALIAIIVIVGAVGYGLMQSNEPASPLLTSEIVPTGSPSADSADQELVASLLALRAVTLNATIFQDPAFKSLQDYGTTIVPEPVGRENPFAPLSATSTTIRIPTPAR